MMNVFSALSLFAVLLYAYTGIFIYRIKKDSPLHRVFLLWCVSMAVWSFGYAFVYVTTTSQDVWMKISALGWCFFAAFALRWVLLFTGSRLFQKSLSYLIIYLPGLLFWYMSVFVFVQGRAPSAAIENFFYTGNFLYNFSYIFLCILALVIWGYKNRTCKKCIKQARILVISSAFPFLLNLLTQTILPLWGISQIPLMGHLYSLFMLYGLYYAVRHYRLFNISSQILNDMVFQEMTDLALLLTPDWRIMKVSRSTELLLGYRPGELLDKPISQIIQDRSFLACTLNSKQNPGMRIFNETECYTRSGNPIPVKISCLPLNSSMLNEPDGIVLIGHEISLMKQLEQQIEHHKMTEEQLRQSEERFKAIFYQNTAIMYLFDCDTLKFFDANMAARKFYGYTEKEFKSKKITDLNGISDEHMKELIKKREMEDQQIYYFKHRAANGEWRDVEVHATTLPMNGRKMLISIVRDITDRKKAEERISYLAYHDALTGLANRKYFYERLHNELERSIRTGNKAAVLFIDLDGFKAVNDQYGHEAGDSLLKEVADRMKSSIRETDVAARMGGDEFTLLVTDIADRIAAQAVANKILNILDHPVMIDGNPVRIQASIGISIFPDDGVDLNLLLSKADHEMYMVKRGKKETPSPLLR